MSESKPPSDGSTSAAPPKLPKRISPADAIARTAELRAPGRGDERLLDVTLSAMRQVIAGKRASVELGDGECRVVVRALAAAVRRAELAADRAVGPVEDLEDLRRQLEAAAANIQLLVRRIR